MTMQSGSRRRMSGSRSLAKTRWARQTRAQTMRPRSGTS